MNYRKSDPITSKEAYAVINSSGKAQAHRVLINNYVKDHPNHTAGEIAQGIELDHDQVSKRMSEIKTIAPTTQRRCRVRGTNQRTWVYINE